MTHLLNAVRTEVARCKEMDPQSALAVRGSIRNLSRHLLSDGDITEAEYDQIVDALKDAYPPKQA